MLKKEWSESIEIWQSYVENRISWRNFIEMKEVLFGNSCWLETVLKTGLIGPKILELMEKLQDHASFGPHQEAVSDVS